MNDDLLDGQLTAADDSGKTLIWNWTGLGILWLGIVMCLILGYWMELTLWLACAVLALGSICFATNHRDIGLAFLLGALAVAQFDLLLFFPVDFVFGTETFRIDMLLVAVMVALMYTNPDVMREWTGEKEPLNTEDREAILDEKSLKFQSRLKNKPTAALEQIVAQRKLVPAAVRAAEIILAKRKATS